LIKLEFSRQIFEKSSNITFYEFCLGGAELFYAPSRTATHVEANSCFSKFCKCA